MAKVPNPRTSMSSFLAPIRWTGFSWEPKRVVRFTDAVGRLCELPVADAIRVGLFDFETTTPERRDTLRAWVFSAQGEDVKVTLS